MNTLDSLTLTNKATAGAAASADNDLVRLVEARALLAAIWQGAYNAATAYTAGQMVTSGGALYLARVGSTGYDPATSPTQWACLVPAGTDGAGQMRLYTTTDPNTDGITPADISKPATAYKLGGNSRMFCWNTSTHVWE